MDEEARLREELRATREELVRRGADEDADPLDETTHTPLMPDRDEAYLRLALLRVEDLESHVDRLERDLRDLREGLAELETPDADE